jgi:hypothetical protein
MKFKFHVLPKLMFISPEQHLTVNAITLSNGPKSSNSFNDDNFNDFVLCKYYYKYSKLTLLLKYGFNVMYFKCNAIVISTVSRHPSLDITVFNPLE